MALTWSDLFLRGSIVDLNTSRWTAREAITAVDLGIDDAASSDAVDRALLLGSHRLIRNEAFAGINGARARARRAIEQHSLPFGFIAGARYVPEQQLEALSVRLRTCKAEFDAEVATFVDSYDAEKAAMLPALEQALQAAAKTGAAAAEALRRVCASYPTAEEVRSRFDLRWNVYAIQGPKTAGTKAALEEEGATVKSALTEMMAGLRDEIGTKLGQVIALIKKGGKLEQRSLESAQAVLTRVESVNVLGDDQLARQISALRALLGTIQAGEDIPLTVVESLTEIRTSLEADLAAAAEAAEERLTGVGRRLLEVA